MRWFQKKKLREFAREDDDRRAFRKSRDCLYCNFFSLNAQCAAINRKGGRQSNLITLNVLANELRTMPKKDYSELDQALDAVDVDMNLFGDEPATGHEKQQQQQEHRVPAASELDPLTSASAITPATTADDDATPAISTEYLVVGLVVFATLTIVVTIVVLLPSWLLVVMALALVAFLVWTRLTIPSRESFHIKNEMQRLKQTKQETTKSKTWLGKKAATVKNVLSTTTKNAVGGYDDVLFMDVGVGTIVAVRDLTNGKCYAWIGVWEEWRCVVNVLSAETNARLHQWLWKHSHPASRS